MFDRQVYEMTVQFMAAFAIETNGAERAAWRQRRDDWLANAAIYKASGRPVNPKPAPPAQLKSITAPPWSEGISQFAITMLLGPELVDDPACDLPPDPAPNPAGVVDVGERCWSTTPVMYTRGPKDTAAAGTKAEKDGYQLVNVQMQSPFGRSGKTGWYQEV